MQQQAHAIRLRLEDEKSPDTWQTTPELASVVAIASNANRATKDPEMFDLSFTTLLYGFLRASDSCCRFFQKYTAADGMDVRAALARKSLSPEALAQLDDTPALPNAPELVYTVSAKNLLTNARSLQTTVPDQPESSEPIDVRHLMGAYIYKPAGHAGDLESIGLSRVRWSKAFREWIRATYPGEAPHWDRVDGDTFKSVAEPDQKGPAAAAPAVSSRSDRVAFDNDLVIEKISLDRDRLNMRPEVERLARLLAARDIHPPIALGLFGRWGSGKSFFMGMLRKRVEELATVDTNGEYAANAVQITFNAWHYQDTSLWASLALRIFEGIATNLGGEKPSKAAEKRRELNTKLNSSVRVRREAERRRKDALGRRVTAVAKRDRAQKRRAVSQSKLSVARVARVWKTLSANKSFDRDLEALSKDVAALGLNSAARGIDDITRVQAQLQKLEGNGQALVGAIGASFRDPTATFFSCLAVALVIGAVIWLDRAKQYFQLPASATVFQLLAVAGAALAWTTRRLQQFSSAARRAEALRQDIASAWTADEPSAEEVRLMKEQVALDAIIQKATDEIAAAEQRTAEAEAEIQRINAGGLVYDFLKERQASSAYLAHLGLISTIRQDFEDLDSLLTDLNTFGTRRIDRIILYIDDLDRCDPDKVVEVLQAVHLLLAFNIFNVVVGVDARWLERALNEMYGRAMTAQGSQPVAASSFRAQNYLEKIFQISYSLGAMNRNTFGQLVADLVPTRSELAAGTKEKGNTDAPKGETGAKAASGNGGAADSHIAKSDIKKAQPAHDEGVIDLRETVGTLFFEDFEETFLKELYAFIDTPRLAKRLVNIYRLLRIIASEDDFEAFLSSSTTGTYRAALVLLAINIGYPQIGRTLLLELSSTTSTVSLPEFVNTLLPAQNGSPGPDDVDRAHLENVRTRIAAMANIPATLAAYAHWAPHVGRYSFDWHIPPETAADDTTH